MIFFNRTTASNSEYLQVKLAKLERIIVKCQADFLMKCWISVLSSKTWNRRLHYNYCQPLLPSIFQHFSLSIVEFQHVSFQQTLYTHYKFTTVPSFSLFAGEWASEQADKCCLYVLQTNATNNRDKKQTLLDEWIQTAVNNWNSKKESERKKKLFFLPVCIFVSAK